MSPDDDSNLRAKMALIVAVQNARIDDWAGAIGIGAGSIGLLWMLRQCAHALVPTLFG